MARYLSKRLLKGLFTFFISITLTFFIIRFMPSNPVDILVDPKMGPEVQAAMMERYGLDKSKGEQYLIFLGDLMKLDLGTSFKSGQAVTEVILERLPWTLLLLSIVVVFALLVGIPIGMFAAKKKGKFADKIINFIVTLGISVFTPFLAFAFLYFFSYVLKILPTGGAYTPPPAKGFEFVIDVLKHSVLPALTLFSSNVASIIMYTRNSMIDVLEEDYIRTAYSKGLREKNVILKHALKNAMIPTITVTGLMIGAMVGGAVLTETIFSWPGIGRLIYDSVNSLDYQVLQGAFIVLSLSVILMNIMTDIMVAWLDPRIKLGG
ncbi:MAG: ABC transporter permease [Tissierellaceae bacterium]|nr:ABC transporter permease [Tissierellaceae bacterium]